MSERLSRRLATALAVIALAMETIGLVLLVPASAGRVAAGRRVTASGASQVRPRAGSTPIAAAMLQPFRRPVGRAGARDAVRQEGAGRWLRSEVGESG